MNPRILKKLSKRADVFIQKHNLTKMQRCVLTLEDDAFESSFGVDRPYLERWNGKPNDHGYFIMLKGTIGYGGTFGYECPEWEDIDAYSLLREKVIDHFTDWKSYSGDGAWPSCKFDASSPRSVFDLAEVMITDHKQVEGKV